MYRSRQLGVYFLKTATNIFFSPSTFFFIESDIHLNQPGVQSHKSEEWHPNRMKPAATSQLWKIDILFGKMGRNFTFRFKLTVIFVPTRQSIFRNGHPITWVRREKCRAKIKLGYFELFFDKKHITMLFIWWTYKSIFLKKNFGVWIVSRWSVFLWSAAFISFWLPL